MPSSVGYMHHSYATLYYLCMHCGMHYAPINVFPHHPPLGIIWGNSGDLTYPNVKFPTVGQTEYVKYTYVYTCIYAYVKYTVYTCVKCPIVGQKFCVNSPSKAPLRPEGGVVGEYIDRCITIMHMR